MTDEPFSEIHDEPPVPVADDTRVVSGMRPATAAERLFGFEVQHLGPDAVRIHGRVERGTGSWFQSKLTDEQRAHHAALEHLIETEQAVADAKAKLAQAEADHAAAESAADRHG